MRKLTTRRTDLMDTSDWAHREMLERLRAMTPEERLRIAVDRIEAGRRIHREAMLRVAEERKRHDHD
ncbi:MAG: hypothetical protein ACHQ50_12125 [Fimbriimonadales bacterium]